MFVLKQVHVAVFDLRPRAFWHFHVRAYVLPERVACSKEGARRWPRLPTRLRTHLPRTLRRLLAFAFACVCCLCDAAGKIGELQKILGVNANSYNKVNCQGQKGTSIVCFHFSVIFS